MQRSRPSALTAVLLDIVIPGAIAASPGLFTLVVAADVMWFDEPFVALKPIVAAYDGQLVQVFLLVGAIVLPSLFVAGAAWSRDQRRGRRVVRTAGVALAFNVLSTGGLVALGLSAMGMQGAGR